MLRSTFIILAVLVCPIGALAECVVSQKDQDKYIASVENYLKRSLSATMKSQKRIKAQRSALDNTSHGMAERITEALASPTDVKGKDALSGYLSVLDYVLAVQDESQEQNLKIFAADVLLDLQASILKRCTDWVLPIEFSERSLAQLKAMQEYVKRDTLIISESER